MNPPLDDNIEHGYATSETCSSSNLTSNDDNDEDGEDDSENRSESWMIPFFVNIFLACASFSIVMPSLAPYILDIGAPLVFLPWVVSSYSIGEMFGSVAIGYMYEVLTKTCKTAGRGPRWSMMLCIFLGVVGSAMYAMAGWVTDEEAAKYCLLIARLIQGVWTGGQQAVEQAYLSAAVHPSKRTEYTATLSTCAVLGFVLGPTIGALLSQINTTIFGLPVNANNAAGIFMLLATAFMLFQTAWFFDGKDDSTGNPTEAENDNEKENGGEGNTAESTQKSEKDDTLFNHMGVTMCMVIFYVHYYSFAVQETITTPLVMMIYRWGPLQVNLLFTAAGVLSLITAFSVRYLTRYVEDRTILVSSICLGFLGSLLLLDLPFSQTLPLWRFLLGFSLITVAFPLGRNVVLGIFGNVLGDVNQGRWMGIIFAISAFPRVIGPFISLALLTAIDWGTWLEFGICTILFGITLLATCRHIDELVPYADFAKQLNQKYAQASRQQLVTIHSPRPSPMLVTSLATRRQNRME
eukprot:CAMPEP_0183733914 /NCGR_PEP_ID=MMETSP0737-20130205/42400_1 /TAXON_ID=385413 /ORGANISM="Thalassiosira miniscula, Strain CCMP1093" /LENGTH=521 /DNA_ID=CAMNT_0025967281 /DNA_START=168 /DNA_END=1733 /DNA_ORIENTATION=+